MAIARAVRPQRSHGRIFYGWWTVLVCALGSACGVAPVIVFTFGVFAKPLAADLHVGRSAIAFAISMIDLLIPFSAPRAGRLVDRHGARTIIVGAHLFLIGCLVVLSVLRPPLWHFYAVFALIGLVGVGTTPVTYSRVVANWFDRRRGLALGIAFAGSGIGTFISIPLAQALIDHAGWRFAYLGLAAFCLVIAVPPVWLFLRAKPQELGLLPDDAKPGDTQAVTRAETEGLSVWRAFRTVNFWLLAGIFFVVAACISGANANLAPLLTDSGVSPSSAAFAASLFGIAIIIGRVGNGYLVDRFFGPRVMAGVFAGAAIGVAVL
jgi:sugar phosphate permease